MLAVIIAISAYGVDVNLRPENNLMLLDPGIGSPFPAAADYNMGGMGAMCVSSPTARAYDPNEGIDHAPKGEFVALLRFDFNKLRGFAINDIALKLAITCGNQSAFSVYNFRGAAGDFDLSFVTSDWKAGWRTAHGTHSTDPIEEGTSFNSFADILAAYPAEKLETLHYDARYPYSAGENWFTFELDPQLESYTNILNTASGGQMVTFMLSPSENSGVCFNVRPYKQNTSDTAYTIRSTGPVLSVDVEYRAAVVDFSADDHIGYDDLLMLAGQWLESGSCDIYPPMGDGIVDMADLAVLSGYWYEIVE